MSTQADGTNQQEVSNNLEAPSALKISATNPYQPCSSYKEDLIGNCVI
jgi:hypothetical protein